MIARTLAIALVTGAVTLVFASDQARTPAQRAQAQEKRRSDQSAALRQVQSRIRAFEQEQQRKIAADTALMQAELTRLRQQHKIRQEAIALNAQLRTASPAQKDAINRRAGELLDQLRKLGAGK